MQPAIDDPESQPVQRVWWPATEYLDKEIPLDLVTARGAFDFGPGGLDPTVFEMRVKKDRLIVKPQGVVGWVALNDRLGLNISPRVPIADLDEFLTRSGAAPKEFAHLSRRYEVLTTYRPEFRDVITRAFLAA